MPARAAMSFCLRMFILVLVGGSAVVGCSKEESEGGGLVLFGRGWGWLGPGASGAGSGGYHPALGRRAGTGAPSVAGGRAGRGAGAGAAG